MRPTLVYPKKILPFLFVLLFSLLFSCSGRTVRNRVLTTPGASVPIVAYSGDNEGNFQSLRSQLVSCISNGNFSQAKKLIGDYPEIIDLNDIKTGQSPLQDLIFSNDPGGVTFLLENGADPNASDSKFGNMPLHTAVYIANKEIINALFKWGADVNAGNFRDESPLYYAVIHWRTNLIDLLLQKGAEINARDEKGQTPLARAIVDKKWDVVKILEKAGGIDMIEHPPSISEMDESQLELEIMYASAYGKNKRIKEILEKRPDLINTANKRKDSPLLAALKYGNFDTAKLLIESGANVNHPDERGYTPLHLAAASAPGLVELLMEKGADVNALSMNKTTPLHLVSDSITAKRLIGKGADVNARDKNGRSPLFRAIVFNKKEVVRILVDSGADVNCRDDTGNTPLHCAAGYSEDREITNILLQNGADENALNKYNMTPAEIARLLKKDDL